MNALFFYFTTLNIMRKKRHLAGVITEEQAKQITGDINKEQDSDSQSVDSLSGGAITEEQAKEIAEAMPNDILKTYVLPAIRYPLTDNVIHRALVSYLSPNPRLKNSVLQRFGYIENWDVSRVTDMNYLFFGEESFNQSLNNWDVSNVENMDGMFHGAISFNQPLDEWNVSKVTNMENMFFRALDFNQPLNSWNVSNVTIMKSMFYRARSFNQPLNNWNGKLSNVRDMEGMFSRAMKFNQPLNNWDVSKVTNMQYMFDNAISFNQPLNNWDVSNVTSMQYMFYNASSFNQPLNNWNVSNVKSMSYMFTGATSLNQPRNNMFRINDPTGYMEMMFNNYEEQTRENYDSDSSRESVDTLTLSGGAITEEQAKQIAEAMPNDILRTYVLPTVRYPLTDNVIHRAVEWYLSPNPRLKNSVLQRFGYIENWDVSRVTDMNYMFGGTSFNQPLDKWDVSNVKRMDGMFMNARSFNQPLDKWDVSNVRDMSYMFERAGSFNQPLNNWNVSKVTRMSYMFEDAESFNQPLNNWDVSKVEHMRYMFYGAMSFNKEEYAPRGFIVESNGDVVRRRFAASDFLWPALGLGLGLGLAGTVSGGAINEEQAKEIAQAIPGHILRHNILPVVRYQLTDNVIRRAVDRYFSPDPIQKNSVLQRFGEIENWDVSLVTNMSNLFENRRSFNQPLNNWNVSRVTNMDSMFANARSFNQPLNNWDVSNVINMKSMFFNAQSFNQPLFMQVSNVTNMAGMFWHASSFNQPLTRREYIIKGLRQSDRVVKFYHWDVSNVTDMNAMFLNARSFNQPLDDWDVSNVTDMTEMFNCASSFNQPLNSWDVSNVTDMTGMFAGFDNENARAGIEQGEGFEVRNVFNQPLNRWDVSNVKTLKYMFCNARNFNQPLDDWIVSNVTDMTGMFGYAESFNQPLNDWVVSNVTDMSGMFSNARSFNQPLDDWVVSKVTDMCAMFSDTNYFNQSLNNWDVSKVTDMSGMFLEAESFNQPLNDWVVSNVTDMSEMFAGALSFNQPLNNWDVSKVTNMEEMFRGATAFNQMGFGNFTSVGSWDVSNKNTHNMFNTFNQINMFHGGATDFMDVDDAASEKVFMEVDNLKKNASPGRDFMDVDQIETTVSIEHRRYLYERWKEISADQCNIFASDVFKNIVVRDANSASDSIIIFLDIIYKGSSRNVYVPSAVIKMTFLGGTTNELEYETQVYSFLMLFKNPFVTQLIKNFSCSDAFSLCKSGIENNRRAMEQIINRIDSLNRKNAQYDYKKVRILLTERGTGSTLFQWNDSDYEWVCVLVQLLFCLAYFEDIGLMHHDLHLGNVLVEKTDKAVTYNLKISKTKFVKFTCNHIVKIYDFDRATVRKTKHQNISSDNSLLNILCNRLGTCNKFTVGWDLAQVCWWLFNTKRDCPSIIKKFIKKTIDNRFLEMDEQLSWKGHSCVKQNAFGNILSTPGGINIGCKKIFNHKSPKHLLETLKFKLNIEPDAPLLSYELPSAGFP